MRKLISITILFVLSLTGCKKEFNKKAAEDGEFLRRAQSQLTEAIIHDIFAPPVSSRIYMYASLAAYEASVHSNPNYQSMVGQLNGFEKVFQPEKDKEYCYQLAATRAFMTVGKSLTFDQTQYTNFDEKLWKDYQATGIPSDMYDNSIALGDSIASSIINYSKKDTYKQTRGFRHTVTNQEGTWVPTPPMYADAVEPNWRKIRALTLDSASQFKPIAPAPFSTKKGSQYYIMMMDAYNTVKNLTEEQRNIANFWDCNPFKMNVTGHVMFATKKMSPGGHWMSITALISRKLHSDYMQTAEAFLLTSVGIFDGFISCWDEKYRSVKVRPESVINTSVDKDWQPVLQTPPFPEYTSGHSVISNAAAVALTSLYGKNVAFADSSEIPYGLPVRSYASVQAAADEASISRLYGGIHFRPALDEGSKQGVKVGNWVISQLKTKKK